MIFRKRVFVSNASEDRLEAEAVVSSIEAYGYETFYDRTSLPPAESFEDRIEAAIGRCGVFVFLISPRAVEAGSFTLTELDVARRGAAGRAERAGCCRR